MDEAPPEPDRSRWARVESLFHQTRRLDSAARAAFLVETCGEDEALRAEVTRLLASDDAVAATPDAAIPAMGGLLADVLDETPLDAEADQRRTRVPSAVPARIGPFTIVRTLGEGGMGVVYEATQESPRRHVALKVIRADVASPEVLRRFALEARVLARLDHPGIAKVFAIGVGDPATGEPPWIAMELVEGRPLLAHADAVRADVRARIELIAQVCDAVAHAHERGVIHRDLKPANVLVDAAGRPRVLDFGVARLATGSTLATSLHTRFGRIVGTLAYMSPEQASGDPEAADVRSDVYSLGVVAYELLAGRPPVDLDRLPLGAALDRLARDDAPTLGAVRPELRGDPSILVGKAMAKERERRYPNAAAFADDLRRYLRHEPVTARAPTAGYYVRKFVRRHRGLVGGVVAAFAALGVGLVLALSARSEEATERARADLAAATARRAAYRAELAGAAAALRGGDPRTARRRLELVGAAERGWEWNYLYGRVERRTSDRLSAPGSTYMARLLPGTDGFATRGFDGHVHIVWPATKGRSIDLGGGAMAYIQTARGAGALAGSVDGRLVAWPYREGAAIPTVRSIDVPLDPRAPVLLAISDDGTKALVGATPTGSSESIPAWLVEVGGDRLTGADSPVGDPSWRIVGGAFSSDSKRFVVGRAEGSVALFRLGSPHEATSERIHANAVTSAVFSPDGTRIAFGSDDRSLSVWDPDRSPPEQRVLRRVRGFGDRVRGVAWSSDGRRVAGVDAAGLCLVGDTEGDAAPLVLDVGDLSALDDVGFVNGDRDVAVAGPRGRATLSASPPDSLCVLRAHAGVAEGNPYPYVYSVAADPTGLLLASGGWDRTVRLFDAVTTDLLATLPCPDAVFAVAFRPDGTELAVACVGGRLRIFRTRDGALVRQRDGLQVIQAQPLAWSPDGARLVVADRAGRIVEIDEATLADVVVSAPTAGPPVSVAISGDGRRVAVIDDAGVLSVRARGSVEPWTSFTAYRGRCGSVAFSPDGTRLITTGESGLVRQFDSASLRPLGDFVGHEGFAYTARCFGSRVVSGGNDATIRVWDPDTREELATLTGHEAYVFGLAELTDGETLVSASGDNTVRIWSAVPFAERLRRADEERTRQADVVERVRASRVAGADPLAAFEGAQRRAARAVLLRLSAAR